LYVVAAESRGPTTDSQSPEERFRVACALTSFALARLHEQAARRGCTLGELLRLYEQAARRFRARG